MNCKTREETISSILNVTRPNYREARTNPHHHFNWKEITAQIIVSGFQWDSKPKNANLFIYSYVFNRGTNFVPIETWTWNPCKPFHLFITWARFQGANYELISLITVADYISLVIFQNERKSNTSKQKLTLRKVENMEGKHNCHLPVEDIHSTKRQERSKQCLERN